MTPTLHFIGIIHSPIKRIEDCLLQESEGAPEAEVTIFPEFIDGIKDLQIGSEVLLLTWLHKADRNVIKCFPRNDRNAPVIGVFSTRSPDRPNPIGIHTARVLSITVWSLKVSALEVVDQTPLIDIKPVLKRNRIG